MFSKRCNRSFEKNALTEDLERKRQTGVPILDLTEVNPTRCDFAYLSSDLLDPFQEEGLLLYEPDPRGGIACRQAICAYYAEKGVTVSPEQVFLTATTSEAFSYLFRLLTNPGEKIGIPKPGYPLFEILAELHDVETVPYHFDYQTTWRLLSLQSQIQSSIVFIVQPNIPIGTLFEPAERHELMTFVAEHKIPLVSDEVFIDYCFDGAARTFAGECSTLTFTVSGASKVLGLPQMKLAWLVVSGPSADVQTAYQRLELIGDTFLSVNAPVEAAFPHWMKVRPGIQNEIRSRIEGNRAALCETFAARNKLQLYNGIGGWYAVIQICSGEDDELLAQSLLAEANLLLHPGYLFELDHSSSLVLSLLPRPADFFEGLHRLSQWVERKTTC